MVQAHPEIVQGTTEFHHQITDSLLPQADPVLHDATALDTAVDMLDAQPTVVQGLVGPLLCQGEVLAAGFLGRHEDHHLRERERQEPQILQEPTSRWQGIRRGVPNGLIMRAAAIRVTEKKDDKEGIDEQDIFHCVVFFLAAITRGLFRRVLGADDPPFRPGMGKRGDTGGAGGTAPPGVGSSSASGVITVAASASETSKRCAKAVRERAGASPRVRRAVS